MVPSKREFWQDRDCCSQDTSLYLNALHVSAGGFGVTRIEGVQRDIRAVEVGYQGCVRFEVWDTYFSESRMILKNTPPPLSTQVWCSLLCFP